MRHTLHDTLRRRKVLQMCLNVGQSSINILRMNKSNIRYALSVVRYAWCITCHTLCVLCPCVTCRAYIYIYIYIYYTLRAIWHPLNDIPYGLCVKHCALYIISYRYGNIHVTECTMFDFRHTLWIGMQWVKRCGLML